MSDQGRKVFFTRDEWLATFGDAARRRLEVGDGRGIQPGFWTLKAVGPDARRPPNRAMALSTGASDRRWLADPSMQEAMVTREVANIVRTWRKVTGTSQRKLAGLLDIDVSHLSRIENGRFQVRDIEARSRIAHRLGLPPQAFGLSGDVGFEPDPITEEGTWRTHHDLSVLELLEVIGRVAGEDTDRLARIWQNRLRMTWPLGEIDRRAFFGQLSAATALFLAAHLGSPTDALEQVAAALTRPRRLDLKTVEHLEEAMVLFRRSLYEIRLPTRMQIADTLSQMKRLFALDPRIQPVPVRDRLVRLIGENAVLAGHLASGGLGDLAAGDAYLEMAHSAAREAEYRELESIVLAEKACTARLRKAPVQEFELVEAGLSASSTTSATTRAFMAATSAATLASAGQETASWRRLDQARAALAERPATSQDWIRFGGFDEVALAVREGSAFLRLQRPRDGQSIFQAALASADVSHPWYGELLMGLASATLLEGEVEEGARLAGEVLTGAMRVEDAWLATEVRDLYVGSLQERGGNQQVRELGDRLRQAALIE